LEAGDHTKVSFDEFSSNLDGTKSQKNKNIKMWDISQQLIDRIPPSDQSIENTVTFLGDESVTNNLATSPRYSIFNSLVDVAFDKKYQNFINDNTRSAKDFLFNKNSAPSYSEVVMYRIAKFDGPSSDVPMKNYYILNTSEKDVVNFYDTQVKINKNYTYIVYSYTMVVGNTYSYENFVTDDGSITFSMNTDSSVKLLEHNIGQITNAVISDPPMIPDVNPYTFFDVDNKIGFNFNSSVGERLMVPVTFNSVESDRITKLRRAQNRVLSNDGKIFYSGDSPNRFYEVYRVEEPPTSELSFANSLRTRTSKTSFVDTIQPNKKYYYLFRAIDNHGSISNPSSVIQVQIIKDRTIFTEIRNYTYEGEKSIKNKTKTFKKYFRIIPSSLNLLLDLERSGISNADGSPVEIDNTVGALSVKDISQPVLGVGEHTIWGKKFKVRIISKSSGKKLDVNFRMKQKYDKPNEELI